MKPKIIILDDEPNIRTALTLALEDDYKIFATASSEECLDIICKESISVCLLDLRIGSEDGIEVLKKIKRLENFTAVIVVTAYGSIRSSVKAMKNGAFGYLTKPIDLDELDLVIKQALEFSKLNEQVKYLSGELQTRYGLGEIIGKSEAMKKVYQLIDRLSGVDSSVVITGESGTGKELVARAIHFSGKRRQHKFVEVNCAAIPEGLLEEELFGHKKGAFTGAHTDSQGKFEYASQGTIFLDEIGDMSLPLQAKLLRVLQQKEVVPIGGNEKIHVDARVIAATNRNLTAMVQNRQFRQDLYFRLGVVEINLPPLRERRTDIPMLAAHFIQKFCRELERPPVTLSKDTLNILLTYDYPGNVRELSNAIEYAVIFCTSSEIQPCDLPAPFWGQKETKVINPNQLSDLTLKEIECIVINDRLKQNRGNIKITAQQLGVSDKGLRNKLDAYGIDHTRYLEG